MTTRTRLSRFGVSVLAAAVLGGLLAPAAPAHADRGNKDPLKASADAQTALANQYSSLSGALIQVYATNAGQTLEQYLASQQVLLSPPSILGNDPSGDPASPTDLPTDLPTDPSADPATDPNAAGDSLTIPTAPALGTADVLGTDTSATPLTATSLADLNAQLDAAGMTLDTSGMESLDALVRSVVAKSNTADGAVTLASAKWMRQLATLRTPSLKNPTNVSVNMPGLPKDSLVFGLFANKALTNLASSNPGLFASVASSGLGSKNLTSAWNKSMLEVYNASRADFSQVLPDPCTGGMLAVMASGDASSGKKVGGSGCSSACITGGLYLNSQTSSLFNPGRATTTGNPFSSLWNSTTLNGLQRWQQKQLLEQNPQLTNQLLSDNQTGATSASCSASSKATKNALGSTLPGIFGQLRNK